VINTALRKKITSTPGPCHLCGDDQLRLEGERWAADHLIPQCFGGEESEANMRKAHSTCNQWRGSKRMSEGLLQHIGSRRRLELLVEG